MCTYAAIHANTQTCIHPCTHAGYQSHVHAYTQICIHACRLPESVLDLAAAKSAELEAVLEEKYAVQLARRYPFGDSNLLWSLLPTLVVLESSKIL